MGISLGNIIIIYIRIGDHWLIDYIQIDYEFAVVLGIAVRCKGRLFFYALKNMEERLAKYTIRAPFDGVLIQADVTKGTLVRAGQKLGEYIDNRSYELALSLAPEVSDLLSVGADVSMS